MLDLNGEIGNGPTMTEDARVRGQTMAAPTPVVAGVALRPIMDLSDNRVIAYLALPRSSGGDATPVALLGAALAVAGQTASAPLLVPLPSSLLLSPTFDPLEHTRAAQAAPSEIVFLLPATSANAEDSYQQALLANAVRRHASQLRQRGYRTGLSDLGLLTVSWEEVAATRPSFLLLQENVPDELSSDVSRAAVTGLLAFAGQLDARLVSANIASDADVRVLMGAGIYYGGGDHLHPPVVLDERVQAEGDLVVRPSWFREQAVRLLATGGDNPDLFFFDPTPPAQPVVDDSHFAATMAEWSGMLSNAANPDVLMERLAEIVPQVVPLDRLAVFEADWDRYVLRPKVLVGEELRSIVGVSHTINTGITGWAFLRGVPYRCGRTIDHPEAAPIPDAPENDESMLVVPLVSGDRRLGVIDIWHDGIDQYDDNDLARVALVAKLAADAWRAASEREELAHRVMTDTLTGVFNKRWWDELAPREGALALRAQTPIAVLLADLDGFKIVNDTYGHAAGDVVLRQVATALQATVRPGDAVVRYGGDEFVLMLRDADRTGAFEVAAEIRTALEQIPHPAGDAHGAPVTAAIGIAFFPEHGATLDDVAVHADAAMYRAKAEGQGQIALYDPAGDREGPAIRTELDLAIEAALSGGPAGPADRGGEATPSRSTRLRSELDEECRRLEYSERLARVGSYEMDLSTGQVTWSKELRRLLGAPDGEAPSLAGIIQRVDPDDWQALGDAVAEWAAAAMGLFSLDLTLVKPFGERRKVRLRQLVRDLEDGRRVLSGTVQELPDS